MTITNKSLITILLSLITSLSLAEDITPIQTIGGIFFIKGTTIHGIGKKLIQSGYANLNLDKMPYHLKTPQAMKKFGLISIPVSLAAMASPFIFKKAQELGKQHREKKEKIQKITDDQTV